MKKLLFLLLVPFIWGQSEISLTYYDYGVSAVDSLTEAVPYKIFTPKYAYEFMTIAIQDTGATYDDSIKIQYQVPGSSNWYPVHFIKDSTFSNVTQPIVDDASVHSYLVYIGDYYTIRVYRANAQAVANRVTYFKFQASLKKPRF